MTERRLATGRRLAAERRVKPDKHETGRRGEQLAAEHLAAKGWTVLARNYRAGPKEIDLVVSRGRTVAFVEVKTRTTRSGGPPLAPVGRRKRRAVETAARRWMLEHGRPAATYRFDAVAIDMTGPEPHVEHFPDAWRPGD